MKKYINLEDMTNTNCSNILDVIQKSGTVSRRQITDLTGLSWGGMTKIVNKLLENGYIVEKKEKSSAGSGRIPGYITVNTQTNFVVGLDINKTGLNAIVMNLSGEVLKEYRSSAFSNRKNEMLHEIKSFISSIFCDYSSGEIIAIGVAMQGIVDSENGISVSFPGIKDWCDVPLKDMIREWFNVNVFVEHDPDCLLYPFLENSSENLLLLRIDKSIGMAASVKHRILKDKGILEIAHTVAVPGGKTCSCGLCGCVEAYVAPCLDNDIPNKTAIDEFVPILSVVIKNMTALFNARKVILTGKLMNHRELLEKRLFDELDILKCKADVIFSGDDSHAVLGAALIAIRKSINSLVI